jgi:hypothetical protein
MKRVLAVVAVLGAVACGMTATPPSDEEMTTRFRSDRAAFEALRETLQASAALSKRGSWDIHQSDIDRMDLEPATADALRKAFLDLKLEWIRGNWPSDGKVAFVTWMADIPGPGHQARGFVWAPSRPQGQPRSPDRASFEEYTPIEGNWYLFAELID